MSSLINTISAKVATAAFVAKEKFLAKKEAGFSTVETIVLVFVAVVLAAIFFMLAKILVKMIFDNINTNINTLFDQSKNAIGAANNHTM